MKKWEYLFIYFDFANGAYRPRLINGKEDPNWGAAPEMSQYANQLGEEGWELTATPFTVQNAMPAKADSLAVRLYFKRPK